MEQGAIGRAVSVPRPALELLVCLGPPLLSQDLLFDGPGGTPFLPGRILMHLNDNSHRGKEPAIMRPATHPTGLEVKNVFDQALHWLHRIAPLLVEVLMSFLLNPTTSLVCVPKIFL